MITDFFISIYILIVDLKVCEPYLESACKIVGEKLGKIFASGNYVTKGCYQYEKGTYKDKIYYGTNGTLESNKKDTWKSGQSRPAGIDCKTGNYQWISILDGEIESKNVRLN